VILIRFLSGSEPTIIWMSHYNISKMLLYCREVGVWCRTGYSSMGPLCGLSLGQNASLTLNSNSNSNSNNGSFHWFQLITIIIIKTKKGRSKPNSPIVMVCVNNKLQTFDVTPLKNRHNAKTSKNTKTHI